MENNTNQKFTTPMAIVVAGIFIAAAVLLTRGGGSSSEIAKPKTLSEQLGVSKEKLTACIKEIDQETLNKDIADSVGKAMKSIPEDERGTPYSIVIGKDGVKTDIRGAFPYEDQKDAEGKVTLKGVKTIIDNASNGLVDTPYLGDVPPVNDQDHVYGNKNALVTVIEYSDYECSYCKNFHSTMKKIVDESNGQVKWIYRHWPIHQGSVAKLVAAECVTKIKGNDAFWKYSELIFGLLQTTKPSVSDQL